MLHRKDEEGPVLVKSNMAVPLVKTVTPSLMKLTIQRYGGPAWNQYTHGLIITIL
jgi:hypothetical protein